MTETRRSSASADTADEDREEEQKSKNFLQTTRVCSVRRRKKWRKTGREEEEETSPYKVRSSTYAEQWGLREDVFRKKILRGEQRTEDGLDTKLINNA